MRPFSSLATTVVLALNLSSMAIQARPIPALVAASSSIVIIKRAPDEQANMGNLLPAQQKREPVKLQNACPVSRGVDSGCDLSVKREDEETEVYRRAETSQDGKLLHEFGGHGGHGAKREEGEQVEAIEKRNHGLMPHNDDAFEKRDAGLLDSVAKREAAPEIVDSTQSKRMVGDNAQEMAFDKREPSPFPPKNVFRNADEGSVITQRHRTEDSVQPLVVRDRLDEAGKGNEERDVTATEPHADGAITKRSLSTGVLSTFLVGLGGEEKRSVSIHANNPFASTTLVKRGTEGVLKASTSSE